MENQKMQGTVYAILFIVIIGGLGSLIYYSSDMSALFKANNSATAGQGAVNPLNGQPVDSPTSETATNQSNTQTNSQSNQQNNNQPNQKNMTPQTIPATSASAITTKDGLVIDDITVGSGAMAKPGDLIAANYLGTLQNGTKFDSSYDRGQPFQFQLGAGNVIKGWDQGIVGMKVGGKRKLIIPASLGYGANGAGSIIPPNATLVFLVELLAVKGK